MAAKNDHIASYILDYYCKTSFPPGFAVLIDGAWGSGKTHLIKSLFGLDAKKKSDDAPIYISLYGVSSSQQIDEAFFQQLHPILSSKGMKIAGAVMRGLLKTTVKIDLEGIGKGDVANVNSQMPDIDLPDYLKNSGDKLIIFDDLERCSMPIKEALGYINSLVEHDERRVIIVADESKIGDDEYISIKEKLIGITFKVSPDFDGAFDNFTTKMSIKISKICRARKQDIEVLLTQSETDNLRILLQSLWEFERFVSALSTEHIANDAAVTTLLRVFFALSFELRAARATEQEIAALEAIHPILANKGNPDFAVKLRSRYPGTDFNQTLVEFPTIAQALCKGLIDRDAITASLNRHQYFAAPGEEPIWRVLWTLPMRDDQDEGQVVNKIEEQFANRKFVEDGEILHVIGLRFWLADIGVLKKSREDILNEGKSYVDDLFDAGKLSEIHPHQFDLRGLDMGWEGLGFRENHTDEFQKFRTYLKKKQMVVFDDSLPEKSQELVEAMKLSADEFLKRIASVPGSDNTYFSVPILSKIRPADFAKTLFELPAEKRRTAFIALSLRYEHGVRDGLEPEIPWLRQVVDELKVSGAKLPPIARSHLNGVLAEIFDPILRKVEAERGQVDAPVHDAAVEP
jgi:hypothetical protein